MASADCTLQLTCSACLNIFTDPVTLRCGHNICKVCIERVLETHEGSGVYTCPDCREEFQECPVMYRNKSLSNKPDNFLSTQPQQQETGMFCTYCIHSPVPAVKSCLICEAFLCDDHLRVHSKSEEHVLSDPNTSLENRKCSIHKKVLEFYCFEDASYVCVYCTATQHSGHQVELLNEASRKKKEELRHVLEELISKKSEDEERVRSLQKQGVVLQQKAGGLTERVNKLFTDVRKQADVLEEKVLSEISRQVDQASRPLHDLIQQLDIRKDKLSGKICDIEELCNVTDPLPVLQEQESEMGDLFDSKDQEIDSKCSAALCTLDEDLISHTLQTGLAEIVIAAYKGIFMREGSEILLDENTAGNNLVVLTDLKSVYWTEIHQHRPKTPQRFKDHQVLSSTSFSTGRHFWAVETSKSGNWRIGMSYPSIARKGFRSYIGCNRRSWGLCKWNNQYSVMHGCKETKLSHKISCHRFGVFLDFEAGQMSFYELCDPIRHLHTFTATFTEPLHAVIRVWLDSYGGAWIILRNNDY
ncbi:E3 ubiquitin-protein ligase TRIM39-like [Mixophyes fleayi]|uniref:E3 ubiquitin-protein ligase TRIM39-like n=1 Tax=Mixophyes fleayi TaxID=3061075 RepID=UPI003F4E1D6D